MGVEKHILPPRGRGTGVAGGGARSEAEGLASVRSAAGPSTTLRVVPLPCVPQGRL